MKGKDEAPTVVAITAQLQTSVTGYASLPEVGAAYWSDKGVSVVATTFFLFLISLCIGSLFSDLLFQFSLNGGENPL